MRADAYNPFFKYVDISVRKRVCVKIWSHSRNFQFLKTCNTKKYHTFANNRYEYRC